MRSPVAELATRLRSIVAKTPVAYTGRTLSFNQPWRNDMEQQMRAMGAVGTLFQIVHRLSNVTSSVQWRLWRPAASGRDEDRVEVTSHLALDIWNQANPFYSGQEFRETFQQHLELTGEAWWVIGRDPRAQSLPLELWPVRPDRMHVVTSPTDFLTGYIYRSPDGEQVPLGLTDVIQLKMPNPLDPYRGMGPVQSILVDLDASKYTAEWNRNFFLNSAEPGGIIEVDHRLSDDEFDEMTMRWREQHQGVAQAHRVAVLEQGKWVDRKFSQRDMQFAELRAVSRDVIREAFGYPKSMLGDAEDVNRANAETGEEVFARWLVKPRLDRVKQKANGKFLPLFGTSTRGLELDYDDPVPENEEQANAERNSKTTAYKTLVDAGVDPDDAAAAVGLPPMRHVTPAPAPLAPVPGGGGAGPKGDAAPAAHPHGPWRVHNAATDPPARLPPDELPDVSAMVDALAAALAALAARWETISAAQKADLVAQVRRIAERGSLADLAALSVDTTDAAAALTDAMLDVWSVAARQLVAEAAAQDVEIASALPNRHTLGQVAQVTTDLLGDELRVSASRAALRANGPNVTPEQVAAAVDAHLGSLSDANAQGQFGGALHGSMNAARIATLGAGPEGAIYAQEMNDRNTCGPCRAVNGRWLGNVSDMAMVEASYPGGAYGGYIDCEGGVRCRGTVTGVWRPQQVGDQPPGG